MGVRFKLRQCADQHAFLIAVVIMPVSDSLGTRLGVRAGKHPLGIGLRLHAFSQRAKGKRGHKYRQNKEHYNPDCVRLVVFYHSFQCRFIHIYSLTFFRPKQWYLSAMQSIITLSFLFFII